ncbi:MAG: recombinase family protein [Parvularcula sp.]|jgi:DNA invertase Pin-like site-specific DNA recombinase|nr:recombinase family protein [Parvularcula sp.]
MSGKRAAIYLRVSTDGQTTANQREALNVIAAREGWSIVQVYEDHGVSGARARSDRPALNQLHKDAVAREFDIVLAWSVDRLGRSVQDLVGLLAELHALKIDLVLPQQGLDTTTPGGKAMFQMMGVFAEFERAMIQERVKAGLERARAQGRKLGRPRIDSTLEREIATALRDGGRGIRKVARDFGVGVGTVQRIKSLLGNSNSSACSNPTTVSLSR